VSKTSRSTQERVETTSPYYHYLAKPSEDYSPSPGERARAGEVREVFDVSWKALTFCCQSRITSAPTLSPRHSNATAGQRFNVSAITSR